MSAIEDKRPTVLVVEDEPLLARNIIRYLSSRGARALHAGSTSQARRCLDSTVVDSLLLDVNLPDGDGLAFYESVRANHRPMSVALVSADCSAGQVTRARRLGISHVLGKPFPLRDLLPLFGLNRQAQDGSDGRAGIRTLRAPRTAPARRDPGRRIMIYTHDAYGLGNARRMLLIAERIAAEDPDSSVLVVSGSPMVHAFRLTGSLDYVKLPTVGRDSRGGYGVRSLQVEYRDVLQLRSNLIYQSILDFDPDVVLVDKKPYGLGDELRRPLELLRKRGRLPACALVLRDILDAPAETVRQWTDRGYYDAVRDYYRRVLVVGCSEVFDLADEYRFPPELRERTRYCGYLDRVAARAPGAAIRPLVGGQDPLVLVTVGGGEDGYRLLETFLDGIADCADAFHTVMVCGPEMAAEQRAELRRRGAGHTRLSMLDFTDDLPGLMESADVVVSMGGYNTVCELLGLGKRAVVVPRSVPVAEQLIRATRMQRLGLLACLDPDNLTPGKLIDAVHGQLAAGGSVAVTQRLDMGGLDAVVREVAELCGKPGAGPVHGRVLAAAVGDAG